MSSVQKKKAVMSFQNDSLIVDESGKTASAIALEGVDPALKSLFKNFDKNDFAKFIQKAWEVNELNQSVEQTGESRLVEVKNATIIMAGLDVLDFSIRRRFYLLEHDFNTQTASVVIKKRLLETARMDGVTLPAVKTKTAVDALDIQKVFPFDKIKKKPVEELDFTRAGNMSFTYKFPKLDFNGVRWVLRRQR